MIGEDGWQIQFSSVAQSCPSLFDPMNCSTLGLPVHHQLLESTQTHVHWVDDAIQPSHPLSSPSPPALNLFQYQGLFKWVSSSHQVAKVLEFQLQHQSFQWIFRTDYFRMGWLDLLAIQGDYLFFIIVKHNCQKIERENNLICLKLNDVWDLESLLINDNDQSSLSHT